MKRALMIAYHFPPFGLSSGVQRTLRFVQHLPSFGWEPIVLTADVHAYESTNDHLMAELPEGLRVERTFALDTARHLAIRGRYPGFLARPDRWMTWQFSAIRHGLRLARKWRPQAIWSTYPIATAHIIGNALATRTDLPWLADFRDPMAQEDYPSDPKTWRSFKQIEESAIRRARFSIFTAPSAAQIYRERYPEAADRITVLENGFDEESFPAPDAGSGGPPSLTPGAVTLLHSGIVYPSERDPTQLFAAVRELAAARNVEPNRFRLRFRAAVHDDLLRNLASSFGIAQFVELLPPIPYRDALREMMSADALLVLQAANCNQQIPAKLYEYLRCGRPILALTDPEGDTAGVLRKAGIDTIARLGSVKEIVNALDAFLPALAEGRAPLPDRHFAAGASRRERAAVLAKLLEEASESPAIAAPHWRQTSTGVAKGRVSRGAAS